LGAIKPKGPQQDSQIIKHVIFVFQCSQARY